MRHKDWFRGLARFGKTQGCLLAMAAALALPASAATITFAQYDDISGGGDWSLVTSGSGCGSDASPCSSTLSLATTSGTTNSLFVLVPGSGLGTDAITADFNFSASSTTIGTCGDNCVSGDSYTQGGYAGSFSYVATEAVPSLGISVGTVLLSATFSSATLGNTNIGEGTSGESYSGSVSLNPADLTMSSQIPGLNFAAFPQIEEDASWTLSSVNPLFFIGANTGTPNFQAYPATTTFTATGAGTFATEPGFAPEPGPATLIGLGLCGLALVSRRLRSKTATR